MKRLGRTTLLAALAAILTAGSGCIVERRYVRDVAPPPGPPPASPRYPSDDVAADSGSSAEPGPGVEVREDYFYDRLSSYGHWTNTPEYGRVWVPDGVASDFRPYYDGHWAYTDWGWTYASTAPWGWACYHYGRWGYGAGLGWYWLPGTTWGPAWVDWRYGGGYVAWAPLGPSGVYWGVSSPAWVVVGENHFTQPIRTVAVPVHGAAPIVAATTPQAHVQPRPLAASGGVIAGPPVGRVSQSIGHSIRPMPVAKVLPQSGLGRAVGRAQGGQTPTVRSPARSGRSNGRTDSWGRSVRPGRSGNPSSRSPGRWGNGGNSSGPRAGARPYGGSRGYGGGARSSGRSSGGSSGQSSSGHTSGGSSGHSSGGSSGHSSSGHHK